MRPLVLLASVRGATWKVVQCRRESQSPTQANSPVARGCLFFHSRLDLNLHLGTSVDAHDDPLASAANTHHHRRHRHSCRTTCATDSPPLFPPFSLITAECLQGPAFAPAPSRDRPIDIDCPPTRPTHPARHRPSSPGGVSPPPSLEYCRPHCVQLSLPAAGDRHLSWCSSQRPTRSPTPST